MKTIKTTTRPLHLPEDEDTTMSERDELARAVYIAASPSAEADAQYDWNYLQTRTLRAKERALAEQYRIADALLAAGYRKPRTISSVEELDALPAKSAILDREGTPWVGDGDKVEPWASVCEDPFGGPIWKDSRDIALPATVLYGAAK
ncbi:hypothetical protein [Arthrobacter sp. UYCu723]